MREPALVGAPPPPKETEKPPSSGGRSEPGYRMEGTSASTLHAVPVGPRIDETVQALGSALDDISGGLPNVQRYKASLAWAINNKDDAEIRRQVGLIEGFVEGQKKLPNAEARESVLALLEQVKNKIGDYSGAAPLPVQPGAPRTQPRRVSDGPTSPEMKALIARFQTNSAREREERARTARIDARKARLKEFRDYEALGQPNGRLTDEEAAEFAELLRQERS